METSVEKRVSIVIDGRQVEVSPARTILEVARELALAEIPTLCYAEGLPPYGSCFLCVVEVKGFARLLPACATRVTQGMEIQTRSERVLRARRMALELLLSNHYADCVGPCRTSCPAGVDVQGYISLIHLARPAEAVALIREANPLPMVCGRVCVKKCEVACRRKDVDEAVGINNLKRYAADITEAYQVKPPIAPETGRRVAVIGAGPAGLSAAYYLRLAGHRPVIFEALPHPGGMLRYGIPEYRLPKEVLDREIGFIVDLGVELKTGVRLGEDESLAELRATHDAVFVGLGAQRAKPMQVARETAPGVVGGIDFLRDVHLAGIPRLHGTVLVVGGGNTAIDAARTALRCGASDVRIVYRRTEAEMPAEKIEIHAAHEEGVEFSFLVAPLAVVTDQEKAVALRVQDMELGEPDASGRRRPVPVAGSEHDIPGDLIISAIGQDIDLDCLGDACHLPEDAGSQPDSIRRTRWNTIVTDPDTFETNLPGVFAGGDVVSGPAVVIDAIAQGRRAALAIDAYLRTGKPAPQPREFFMSKDLLGGPDAEEMGAFEKRPRAAMPELDAIERIGTFEEVERGLAPEQAMNETLRCLECGCQALLWCDLRRFAGEYGVDPARFSGEVRRHKLDLRHPLIALDQNKCILCGKCVRTCSEVLDISAWGFVNRGFRTQISPALGKPLHQTNCTSCGNCIDVCPTGAISQRLRFGRIGYWAPEIQPATCAFCSVGCSMEYRILAPGYTSVSRRGQSYLCAKGRFGHTFIQDAARLAAPVVRHGFLRENADWETALDAAADGLKKALAAGGPEAVAVLGSPRMTLEEQYALGWLARRVLGTPHVGSFSEMVRGSQDDELQAMLGQVGSTVGYEALEQADVIFIAGADPDDDNPVLAMKIRQAAKRGARLIVAHSEKTRLARRALHLDVRPGTMNLALAAMARLVLDRGRENRGFIERRTRGWEDYRRQLAAVDLADLARRSGTVSADLAAAAELVSDPGLALVTVFGADSALQRAPHGMTALLDLVLLTGKIGTPGSGLLLARQAANGQGLREAGLTPGRLPGQIDGAPERLAELARVWGIEPRSLPALGEGESPLEAMRAGRVKALLILGENPLIDSQSEDEFAGLEFVVAGDLYETETTRRGEVALPLSAPGESDGLLIGMDRRARPLAGLASPPGGRTTLAVIEGLAARLGGPERSFDPADLRVELAALAGLPDPQSWRALPEGDRLWAPDMAAEGRTIEFAPVALEAGVYRPIEMPYGVIEQRFVADMQARGIRW